MFERFSEPARRVLFFARYEASQYGSFSIGPDHLLLGLVRDGKGLTSRLFARFDLTPDAIRKALEPHFEVGKKISTSVEIPFAPAAKHVLQYAAEESERLLHNHIGTEHLLLGILREDASVAAKVLVSSGLRLDNVRDGIVGLLRLGDASDRRIHGTEAWATHYPVAPMVAPSYDVRVSVSSHTGHATACAPDYWTASGLTLRAIVARLFKIDERRVDLPPGLDTTDRYDVVLRLPAPETYEQMERRVVEGVERQFGVSIGRQSREREVFVLTAHTSPAPGLREEGPALGGLVGGGSFGFTTEFTTMATGGPPDPFREKRVSFGNLQMSGLTIGDLCMTLEEMFGTPFVDDTGLAGIYDVSVVGEFRETEQFLAAMRDQLGLVATRSRRVLDVVTVRRK